MTSDLNKASCADFQSRLADMIGAGEDLSHHPHIVSCELCRALLADLETIAEAARQLLPAVEPPDLVWQQIESAIKDKESKV
jgi:hypothetical protein